MIEKWDHAPTPGIRRHRTAGRGRGKLCRPTARTQRGGRGRRTVMPTVCVEMLHFVGDFDQKSVAMRSTQMKSQLSVMAEIGGRLAMTPASYGMFINAAAAVQGRRVE